MSEPDYGGVPATAIPVVLSYGRHAPDDPPPLEPSASLDTIETETRHYRHDGWTPALRAAFLDTLATSGVVTDACREVQRSSQAAYALRNRDRLFAAGWDAALTMARPRLADELYHRAIHGTVDQIWKDGVVIAERHRHDNRLSVAVLTRLDARADRAERTAAPSLRLAAVWDAWLAALAEDRIVDAQAMLDPPPPAALLYPSGAAILGQGSDSMLIHQLHQLRAGKALDEEEEEARDDDRVWIENHTWRTNFPPPRDFEGDEDGDYGDDDYNRPCTPEEWAVLDRSFPDAFSSNDMTPLEENDAAERDAWFAALADELEPATLDPPDEPCSDDDSPPAPVDSPTPCTLPRKGAKGAACISSTKPRSSSARAPVAPAPSASDVKNTSNMAAPTAARGARAATSCSKPSPG